MILIADCGSTKIEWCLIEKPNRVNKKFTTPGMNMVMLSSEELHYRLSKELYPNIEDYSTKIQNVYFYGAGCVSESICQMVKEAIDLCLPCSLIQVYTDLLGAAHALCGNRPGVACILGTGSNSCYYDGEKIVKNVSPLGYILGDEGSGAVLGKRLIGDVLKNQLPKNICEDFLFEYDLDLLKIIENVYRKPQANKFLASFVPFIYKYLECPEVFALVEKELDSFVNRNIRSYTDSGKVNFVGSVAFYFQNVLRKVLRENGYELGEVMRSPMEGLVKYYENR